MICLLIIKIFFVHTKGFSVKFSNKKIEIYKYSFYYNATEIVPFLSIFLTYIWEDLPWWLSHQEVGNFCPSLYPHYGLFHYMLSLLMLSSEPIGKGESYYAKIWAKFFCIHSAIKFKLSWNFGWQFLKSYISKTGRAFDLILNLTAGP